MWKFFFGFFEWCVVEEGGLSDVSGCTGSLSGDSVHSRQRGIMMLVLGSFSLLHTCGTMGDIE